MLKKIIFGVIVTASIVAGILWFNYTREFTTPVSDGINAIPNNAAIIFESKQAKNTWRKIAQTNIMWEELLGTPAFTKLDLQGKYIDSLLNTSVAISELLNGHSVFISIHPTNANTFDLLYVYSLPNLTYQTAIEEFIKQIGGSSPYQNYEGEKLFEIHTKEKIGLKYTFVNGILMMSTQQHLLEVAIHQLKSGNSLAKDKNFNKVIGTTGENVDANMYINYKAFSTILHRFVSPEIKNEAAELANFADYSGWDINIKPNALMLNGFTEANDSSVRFLNLFSKQKPQGIELTKILPSKTALLLFFGISNTKAFYYDYKNYLKAKGRLKNYDLYVESINKKYTINCEHSMLDWIDNEMALVITEPTSAEVTDNVFAVIRSNNIKDAINKLNLLVDSVNKKDEQKLDTTSYKNYLITYLNLPEILPTILGWQFNKINNNYFTSIGNYVVFANSKGALHDFINDFENNKTLYRDKNYKAFSENISNEVNIYLYSAIARSPDIYKKYASKEFSSEIDKHMESYRKFEAVGIQFTANKKLFYSNIYLKYNPIYKKETGTLWEAKLDTTLSSKPHLLINHNTKAKEIFVQDDANKIYLISNTGKIIWTKQLPEIIVSDIIQIDVLKNNKVQMVFNTRNTIYMYDRNGNEMKGFPLKLKSPATNAIAVFDYEEKRDYRIFIACENKKILCLKTNGEQVDGFKFDKTDNSVSLPIQYFNLVNKDHLCAIDSKGKIYILDRHGKKHIDIKEQMPQNINNFYVETGKDYSQSYFVAIDTLGNVVKISLTGDKESIKLQTFENTPYFDYKDINNDKIKDYIFLTHNKLKVFSQDKSLLYSYEFKSAISQPALFFMFPNDQGKIGVACDSSNELYLFNENGSLYNGFPLTGKTLFSIGDINNEGMLNLITASADNSIYVYQLNP